MRSLHSAMRNNPCFPQLEKSSLSNEDPAQPKIKNCKKKFKDKNCYLLNTNSVLGSVLDCCSVAQSHPALCDPTDCSTIVLPVLHCLLAFAQTHVWWWWCHWNIPPSVIPFSCPQSFPTSGSSSGWSFSFSISPSNEYSGLISFRIDWFDLPAIQGTQRVFSSVLDTWHLILTVTPWFGCH